MARELRTAEEFRQLASDAEDAASKLREVADLLDKDQMEGLLVHGGSVVNQHLPRLWEWSNSMLTEYQSQSKAYLSGRESKASYDQRRHRGKVSFPVDEPEPKPRKKKTPKKKG